MRVKTLLFIIFFSAIAVCFAQKQNKTKQEVDYVNTYIGTAKDGAGGLMPCVGPPYAMTNFTAQTNENMVSRMPYLYEDSTILGFLATHQPTIWMGDYGYVSIMPEIGSLKFIPEQRKLAFSHKDEFVSPYYYSVKMKAGEGKFIKSEIAASERCGIFKITFPESKDAHIVIQALNIDDAPEPTWCPGLNSKKNRLEKIAAYINVDKEKNEITGYNPDRVSYDLGPELPNFKGYFIIQFDKPFNEFGTWDNDGVKAGSNALTAKKRLGAYISFSTKKNETVKVKIASSFISLEQARENLKREIPDWNFEKVSEQTRDIWQKSLERIKIDGATEEQKTIFYTAFYHCQLLPRMLSEYGKYYSAFDDKIHEGISYNDYSLWDTFRALHPFLVFMEPGRDNDMIISMLQMYKEGGRLPMWPNPAETNVMIGTHADEVIADAYVKGIRNYDVNLAYEAMRKDGMMPTECDVPSNRFADRQVWIGYEGRMGLPFYHSIGYVPSDYKGESVSRTVEYGINDYSVAQVAKDLGKTSDYERMMKWSQNYKNLYNSSTGFLAPRLFNGDWDKNPEEGFTEGSPWTYLFGAMHDVPGMIEMMGGNEKFAEKLDKNFAGGFYKHDNEPGHHFIYLYDYCGQPWKTQEQARVQTTINYLNKPNGINGNDDCGQMSAWYMFSVMGFYPVTPASGIYSIGAPQFKKLTMNYTVDGKPRKLEIFANNISDKNKYIQKVTLLKTSKVSETFEVYPIEKPFISHKDIINGSKLIFEMGPSPNYNWK